MQRFLDWLYPQLISSKTPWKVSLIALGSLSLLLLVQLLVMAFVAGEATEDATAPEEVASIQQPLEVKTRGGDLRTAPTDLPPAMLREGEKGFVLPHRFQAFEQPTQGRVLLLMNRHLVLHPLFAPEPQSWRLSLVGGNEVFLKQFEPLATAEAQISFDRQRGQSFGLQLARVGNAQWVEALALARRLQAKGYLAYLHRSQQREQLPGETAARFLYRLRVGFYDSEETALDAAAKIQQEFAAEPLLQKRLLVTHPDFDEYGNALLDLRPQPYKPWMLVLGPGNLEPAEEQLRALMDAAPFAYLVAKRDTAGKTSYQVKAGFFETQEEAESALFRARQGSRISFPQGQILRAKLGISPFDPPAAQLLDHTRLLPPAAP